MRAEDLDLKELLELDPEGGQIRFAGQRALLVDAVAMGLLRKYLVENFGSTAARTVLTQFGFAHGWRMAEAMQGQFAWESPEDRRRAGTRIHTLAGLFRLESGSDDPMSKGGSMLASSYEAEQHLLHFGRSDEPMCWTICGLISGYLSRTVGEEIFVLEDRCLCRGDSACHLVGRNRDHWRDEHAEELRYFSESRLTDCLDVSLQRVTETLKLAERKLQRHRRALIHASPEPIEPSGIIARSPAMRLVMDMARRVARVDFHRAHHRRERRGQGAHRPAGARRVGAGHGAVHRRELWRHHGDAARERALSATPAAPSPGPPKIVGLFRGGQRRHPVAGRDRRGVSGMQVKLLRVLAGT
jgi:two-component system response regulator HydG